MSFWKSVKFLFNGNGSTVLDMRLVKFGFNFDTVSFMYNSR